MSYRTTVQIARCTTKNGKPSLDLDFELLQQIMDREMPKMVMVVCISGAYRSGKSFFMSLLLQYLTNNGSDDWINKPMDKLFHYRNSSDRVTAGIWIWSEPFTLKNGNGNDVAIFLMDSQGWHDDMTTLRENGILSSFATIMSSVMIFNVEKNIRETDIESLQRFAYNAKLIDDKFIDEPFQKLIVLIRDWNSSEYSHGYYYHNRTEVNDFVHDKLKPKDQDQSEDSRRMRELIQYSYDEIDACLMPYPGEIVGHDRFDAELVETRFSDQINQFCRKLFHPYNLIPKRYNGEYLSCSELFDHLIEWNSIVTKMSKQLSHNYKTDIERIFQRSYQDYLNSIDKKFKDRIKNCTAKSDILILMKEINELKTRNFPNFELNAKLDHLDKMKKDEMNEILRHELDIKAKEYLTMLQIKLDELQDHENVNNLEDNLGDLSMKMADEIQSSKSQAEKLTNEIAMNAARQSEINGENYMEFDRIKKEQAIKDAENEARLRAAVPPRYIYRSRNSDCTII